MRVLIVNDKPPVRATVHMLSSLSDFEPVGEAANGMEAVQLMQTQRPAVVLMDIHMPGMVSLEAPPSSTEGGAAGYHLYHGLQQICLGGLRHTCRILPRQPFHQERLEQALNKARKLAQAQLATLGLQKVGRRTAAMPALIRGNLELISVDDELFFQADQKYMIVRHRNGEVLIEDALKNLEPEFTDRLIRIRRNALANILVHQRHRKGRDARFLMIFKGINDRLEIRPSARGGRQKVPKSELSKLGKLSASCNTRARTSSRADKRA